MPELVVRRRPEMRDNINPVRVSGGNMHRFFRVGPVFSHAIPVGMMAATRITT
jgi:hypothetical protein